MPSLGLSPQDFYSSNTALLPPAPQGCLLNHRPTWGHTGVSTDTHRALDEGSPSWLQPLRLILMASYSKIPALCLIMVGINTKHTLQGRWEDTQPRRQKLCSQMSLAS